MDFNIDLLIIQFFCNSREVEVENAIGKLSAAFERMSHDIP
jgi:hypothetical protein